MIKKLKIKIKDELQSYTQEVPVDEHKEFFLSHSDEFLSSTVECVLRACTSLEPTEIKISVEYLW